MMQKTYTFLAGLLVSIALIGVTTACNSSVQTTVPRSLAAAQWNPLNDSEKTDAWAEQLLGEVLTYKTLAEGGQIQGNFNPYVDVLVKARDAYRSADRAATYETVNQFMTMLEVRAGEIDPHVADTIWDACYRWTPDEYHSRERHARAMGSNELTKWEQFLKHQEDKASISF